MSICIDSEIGLRQRICTGLCCVGRCARLRVRRGSKEIILNLVSNHTEKSHSRTSIIHLSIRITSPILAHRNPLMPPSVAAVKEPSTIFHICLELSYRHLTTSLSILSVP